MNSRERLKKVIKREIPDCVPVAPDFSNMIPAKLTGKPFWELYLYKNPPIYLAYINAAKKFDIDSLMDGYAPVEFESELKKESLEEVIIFQNNERIITQRYDKNKSTIHKKSWEDTVTVYYRDNPPTQNLKPALIGLEAIPKSYKRITGVKSELTGQALLTHVKNEMGDQGLVGVFCGTSGIIHNEEEIYDFYDNPEKYYNRRDQYLQEYTEKFYKLMALDDRPDFICTGASGTLVFQTPQIFRELALPIVKKITRLCKEYNIPSHIHSCGPQSELVKICAKETDLTIIDPLEIPPMGDCDLAEIKKLYGDRLILKGNLHTTDIMLHGSTEEVIEASKKAIDAAAEGGGFILSTGDQCGRDTPFENIHAMVETARSYGKY